MVFRFHLIDFYIIKFIKEGENKKNEGVYYRKYKYTAEISRLP